MSPFYQQLATLTPEQRALFEQKLVAQGLQTPTVNRIPRRDTDQALPLSFAQQRLWFMQQLEPENTAYNVASVLTVQGPLNIAALENSLNTVVERHEVLRTRFRLTVNAAGDPQPQQQIDAAVPQGLTVIDCRSAAEPQATADAKIRDLTQTPFDLTQPILRTALLQVDADCHLLVLATHHIVSDRWSVMVFLREMTILYRAFSQGLASPLPPLPIQYADWALWQRQQLQGEQLQRQIDYWTGQLAGELPILDLPTDRGYGPVATYEGAQVPLVLSPRCSQQLRALASESQVTLFTVLLTALQVLLHRYTGSDDIVVGSEIANRDRPETENLIGLLVNTLVFRSDLSENPRFQDLLQTVRRTVLEGLAHQDLPFEKLVEVMNPERHLSQMMPLFQVKLDLQQVKVNPMQLEGLTLERYPLQEHQAKYELRFNLQDTAEGISGQVEYNCDLFDHSTIVAMIRHFQTMLAGIVADPNQRLGELPLLSAAEQQMLLVDWNQTQRPYPTAACIHQLFEAQVEKTPDAIALTHAQTTLTYATLNQRANQLAHHLRAQGVGCETRVGVCTARSWAMVVGLLAILKAGGTYVPLDPTYPAQRLAFILQDAEIPMLLTQGETVALTPPHPLTVIDLAQLPHGIAAENSENLAPLTTPNHLAYVIYTSGSTGQPKGVAIEHRSTVTLLHWAQEQFTPAELTGVLAATSICFDLSVFELFVPLSWGGRVVLVDNALAVADLPADAQVSLINTVPSVLKQLLKLGPLPASVQTVNLAGEALPGTLVQHLQQLPHLQHVYNLYGPSEDTTYSTCAVLEDETIAAAPVPIGRPIANTQAYVLDRHQQPVPVGVVGELYLGGAGLARGYLHRPELTQTAFVEAEHLPAPLGAAGRLYQTGDRVRYRKDGVLEFLGRFDHQVKIRGFRIETGEVETALRRHPAVHDGVVVAHGEPAQQLVAYVVPQGTLSAETDVVETLRAALAEQLPAYLVPTLWRVLDALPQLPNGKINRRALPPPAVQQRGVYVAPRSATEMALAQIWAAVLQCPQVSIHDNFFAIGGHSLLAIHIMAQIEAALGRKVPLRSLFQAPTIAELATQIEADIAPSVAEQRPPLTADLEQRHQPFPLTDIQQAYWLGRAQAFELGNIGTHGYREIEVTGLAVTQIEAALNCLIERHDMLRAVVNTDGQQHILPQVPQYRVAVTDVRAQASAAAGLLALRERMSHQVFTPEQWPLFQIEAAQLSDDKLRFFVSFDVLIGDAWSFQLLGQEMAQLLQGNPLVPLRISFRDYVIAEQAFRDTAAYQQALDYWQRRLPQLPPAPELPLTMAPSQVQSPRFERRRGRLAPPLWQQLKQRAYQANLTPSGVVLAAFAEVLATWSRQPQFTLNLTLFNRYPLHPEVNRLVGDFTASLLLAIDHSGPDAFGVRAQRLQTQLWSDLDHRAVSGVQVLRQLARQQHRSPGALMPVVFTSTLNQAIPAPDARDWQTEMIYSVSQTSQVYLDHQVSEIAGALVFNWDAIAALFPAGMLDQMFAAYRQLLHQLATEAAPWQTRPQLAPIDYLDTLNQTDASLTTAAPLLHILFWQQVQQQPHHPAIIAPDQTLTYRELAQQVQGLAQRLQPIVTPNQLVAVSMEKGWQQVVAVLGILTAGAAYVPIDPSLPPERRGQLLKDTAAQVVLTTTATPDWPAEVTQIPVSLQSWQEPPLLAADGRSRPTDLAYVIYTSGSTGTPKGVMTDHQGAVNTILDINQRFGVGNGDRIFALSSLSFDLSVYDIFGTLAAGATLVIPAAAQVHNPGHWRQLLTQHQVTIWNSVPALLQLLIAELEATAAAAQPSLTLRLALLSGDWIPLTLPEKFKHHCPTAQLISLGGATEASIWSIFYPIETVDSTWHSIPYGRPLANQQWYVLDQNLCPCPPWVPGQLYIGGIGLAQGYWHQPQLTAERFIDQPLGAQGSPTRLYKTGDLGRYRPDGTLEFLGREDFQVKINGYRIELGEIETALQQYPAIESAVVNAVGSPPELVAYVVPQGGANHCLNQPLAQLAFKQQQLGIRAALPGEDPIELPQVQTPANILGRQSHRQFLAQPVALEALSGLLQGLQSLSIPHAPLPKYRYPSAGSLYPIQTYLHVNPERISELAAGWYYYHPGEHRLVKLTPTADGTDLYGPHHLLHNVSAFSLFFVAQMEAIVPIYADQARDFCLIETGYMGQLLMETAPDFELGLCPIGGFNPGALQQRLSLSEHHQPLHALLGGAIDPNWTQQWMTFSRSTGQVSMSDTLRTHLSRTLPSYMVPTRYHILEQIPLTANGKVDRQALPVPSTTATAVYVAPTTATETTIVALWQTLLERERVGIHDNFFEVGGNSLAAIQLLSQLQQTFAVELSIAQLFKALTPAAQARLVDAANPGQPEPPAIQPIPRQTGTPITAVDQLSNEHVDDLLAQLLAPGNEEVTG